jgi:hypothetical protein
VQEWRLTPTGFRTSKPIQLRLEPFAPGQCFKGALQQHLVSDMNYIYHQDHERVQIMLFSSNLLVLLVGLAAHKLEARSDLPCRV